MENKASAANSVGGVRRRPAGGKKDANKGTGTVDQTKKNFLFNVESDGGGLKVGPITVLVISLSFMVTVVGLHILSKFKAALSGEK